MKTFKKVKRALLCSVAALLVPGMVAVPSSIFAQGTETGSETFTENDQTDVNVIETTAAGEEVKDDGGYNDIDENAGNTDNSDDSATGSNNKKKDNAVSDGSDSNNAGNSVKSDGNNNADDPDKAADHESAGIGEKQDGAADTNGNESANKGTDEETNTALKTETVKRSGVGAILITDNVAAPTGDIKSVTFDKTSAKPGDVITITMEPNSEKLKGPISLYVVLKTGDVEQEKFLTWQQDTGKYTCKVKINDSWKNGTYIIKDIYSKYNYDLAKIEDVSYTTTGVQLPTLKVSGSKEDKKGPVVKSVRFDKKEYKAGDTINLTITIEDVSGLSESEINNGLVTIVPEGGGWDDHLSSYLVKQSETVCTATFETDNTRKNGIYNITYMDLYDTVGNRMFYRESLSDWEKNEGYYGLVSSFNPPTIKLTGSLEDREGPTVSKINFDKKSYQKGEKITATITASDKSGIFEGIYASGFGDFHSAGLLGVEDTAGNRYNADVRVDEKGGLFAQFKPDDTWTNGQYTVKYVQLYDKLDNTREYGTTEYGYEWGDKISSINCASFTVSGSKGDREGPVVKAINFNKTNVKPGDKITVTAEATDASGVDHIDVTLAQNNSGYEMFTIRKNASGVFAGEINIDNTWLNGTYDLHAVYAYDALGNERGYDPYLKENTDKISTKKITVSGSKEISRYEEFNATVTSVTFDKKSVKPGDIVNVTADSKNAKEIVLRLINEHDFTDDNYTTIGMVGDGGEPYKKSKEVVLTPDGSGKLRGQITIDNSFKNGEYSIQYMNVTDESGECRDGYSLVLGYDNFEDVWTYKDKYKLFGATFTVANGEKDIKGPVVKSVSIDKNTIKPGEEFTLTLELEDETGIDPYVPIITMGTKDFYYSWSWHNFSADDDTPLDGKWSFGPKVDNSVKNGEYLLSEILLRDSLGNVTYLANDIIKSNPNFYYSEKLDYYHVSDVEVLSTDDVDVVKLTITGSEEDFNGPEITSLKMDKTSAKQYTDKITFTATLDGSAEIDYVNVLISKDTRADSDNKYVVLKKQSDGSIRGELVPDADWTPGEYYITKLYAVDKNHRRYEVGYNRSANDKRVEDLIIGSDRFEVVRNDISITLDKKLLVLDKGKTGKLTATITPATVKDKTVTWSSSDTNVATVDANGNVKAVNSGSAVITAKAVSGMTADCEVRVNFIDVTNPSSWYYKAVYWAAENGITTGSNGKFNPAADCTREQAVTFLWRMAGKPDPKSMVSKFSDVTDTKRYSYKAIMWGSENGLITGSKGKFYPESACTREQIVTIIWRLTGKPAPKKTNTKFKDVTNPKSYSYKAIMWADEQGIAKGSDGLFRPQTKCKRRDIVTFIYRYKN